MLLCSRGAYDQNSLCKEEPSLKSNRLQDFMADKTSTTATYHTHGNTTEAAAVDAAKKNAAGKLSAFDQAFGQGKGSDLKERS